MPPHDIHRPLERHFGARGSACAWAAVLALVGVAQLGSGSVAASQDDDVPPLRLPAPAAAKPLTAADLPPPSVFAAFQLPRSTHAALRTNGAGGRNAYRAIIDHEAASHGVPPELVDAVMAVESSYNSASVGADGEVGLMQVMLATARMLGFAGGVADLAVPETNIHYGVLYLATAWRLAGRDICTATMKYRAGHGETRFSFRSVDYCVQVRGRLAARGFPVTGTVPQPTFGQSAGTPGRRRIVGRGGGVDFWSINARWRDLALKVAVRTFR